MEYRQLQQDQQLAGTKEPYTPGKAQRLNRPTQSAWCSKNVSLFDL